jgi:antitoxin (DNA-binding transcriptional repressor) of toxin-antitoxin stability system
MTAMPTVNMHEAKTRLSKLVKDLEDGAETEIILARNGQPVAKLVPVGMAKPKKRKARRLGIAEGLFQLDYEAFQALDEAVWHGVLEEPIAPPPRAVTRKKRAKSPA